MKATNPILAYSELTDRVYIVHGKEKYDVTDSFKKISLGLIDAQVLDSTSMNLTCKCGNELTEKEVFYDTCLKCGETTPE